MNAEKRDKVSENSGEASISIIVPVFNEAEAIPHFAKNMIPVIETVSDLLGPQGEVELLFIDDGSSDATVAQVFSLKNFPARVHLVKLSRNFGKDNALAAGLAMAKGDAVVPMDVDLQDPPEILPKMVAAWLKGAKVVNALRSDRSSDSWFKRTSAGAFYRTYNRIADTPLEPNVGDFRLLDREVVNVLNSMPERIRFMKGMFSWVGYSPVHVEYTRPERVAGQTKWKIWPLWNFALDGITGSTTLPLRIWTYFGGVVAFGALLYAIVIVFRTIVHGIEVPGYASLMVVLLTIGALNMIALGILGEYIGRIAVEVRQRPLYIIEMAQEISQADETKSPEAKRNALLHSDTDYHAVGQD